MFTKEQIHHEKERTSKTHLFFYASFEEIGKLVLFITYLQEFPFKDFGFNAYVHHHMVYVPFTTLTRFGHFMRLMLYGEPLGGGGGKKDPTTLQSFK